MIEVTSVHQLRSASCFLLPTVQILVRFGHYYPERLKQALVINAPGWFTYPWKLLSSFLDANTRCGTELLYLDQRHLTAVMHTCFVQLVLSNSAMSATSVLRVSSRSPSVGTASCGEHT